MSKVNNLLKIRVNLVVPIHLNETFKSKIL